MTRVGVGPVLVELREMGVSATSDTPVPTTMRSETRGSGDVQGRLLSTSSRPTTRVTTHCQYVPKLS